MTEANETRFDLRFFSEQTFVSELVSIVAKNQWQDTSHQRDRTINNIEAQL